jgi:hypothetical protein
VYVVWSLVIVIGHCLQLQTQDFGLKTPDLAQRV